MFVSHLGCRCHIFIHGVVVSSGILLSRGNLELFSVYACATTRFFVSSLDEAIRVNEKVKIRKYQNPSIMVPDVNSSFRIEMQNGDIQYNF